MMYHSLIQSHIVIVCRCTLKHFKVCLMTLVFSNMIITLNCAVYPSLEEDAEMTDSTVGTRGDRRRSDEDDDLWRPQG